MRCRAILSRTPVPTAPERTRARALLRGCVSRHSFEANICPAARLGPRIRKGESPRSPESPGRRARDPGCFEPALRVELPLRPVERSKLAKGRPDPPRGAGLARFFPATQRAVGRAAQKPPLTTRRSTRGAPGADRARARPARAFRRRPRTSSPRARPATRATPREPRNDLRARRRTPGVRCADPTHRANPLPAGLWRDRSVRFSHPKPDRRRARTSSNAR